MQMGWPLLVEEVHLEEEQMRLRSNLLDTWWLLLLSPHRRCEPRWGVRWRYNFLGLLSLILLSVSQLSVDHPTLELVVVVEIALLLLLGWFWGWLCWLDGRDD
jgi:hypothetical protein